MVLVIGKPLEVNLSVFLHNCGVRQMKTTSVKPKRNVKRRKLNGLSISSKFGQIFYRSLGLNSSFAVIVI